MSGGTINLRITVAYAAHGAVSITELALPIGATVREAVAASGLCAKHALSPNSIVCAIFGQRATADTPLVDGDRVEITRALIVDPKEARHARAAAKPQAPRVPRDGRK